MKKFISLFILLLFLSSCGKSNPRIISETSRKEDFLGKPSVIVFGGTYCPHCQKSIPIFKEEIWDSYKGKINIWINVIDQKKFNVEEVPQGYNKNLEFETLTNSECNLIPSWVILDKKGSPVLKSCGTEKTLKDMKEKIETELKK